MMSSFETKPTVHVNWIYYSWSLGNYPTKLIIMVHNKSSIVLAKNFPLYINFWSYINFVCKLTVFLSCNVKKFDVDLHMLIM